MSNRWPQIYDPEDSREYRRVPLRERYLPPPREGMSPIVIIVLILAALTCLFICGIVMLIPLRWLIIF